MDPTVTLVSSSASRSSWLVSLFDVVENRPGRQVSLGRDHDGILEGGVFQGDFNQVAVHPVQDAAEYRVQVTVKVLQFASAQVVLGIERCSPSRRPWIWRNVGRSSWSSTNIRKT